MVISLSGRLLKAPSCGDPARTEAMGKVKSKQSGKTILERISDAQVKYDALAAPAFPGLTLIEIGFCYLRQISMVQWAAYPSSITPKTIWRLEPPDLRQICSVTEPTRETLDRQDSRCFPPHNLVRPWHHSGNRKSMSGNIRSQRRFV